jgi:hypothetical protein
MESIFATLRELNHAWLVGGALVTVHSYLRFITPPTSRSLTTAGRYHSAALLYTFATAFAWIALANSPELLGGVVPKEVQQLSVPLYVALVLTVLLPNIKSLSKYDDQVRAFLQDLARIPYEALRLIAVLRRAEPVNENETVGVTRLVKGRLLGRLARGVSGS